MLVLFFVYVFFSNKTITFRMFFAVKKKSFYVNYQDNTTRQNFSIKNLLKIHFFSETDYLDNTVDHNFL